MVICLGLSAQGQQMIKDAQALEAAGAQLLVLECIPAPLGKAISEVVTILTICLNFLEILYHKLVILKSLLNYTSVK